MPFQFLSFQKIQENYIALGSAVLKKHGAEEDLSKLPKARLDQLKMLDAIFKVLEEANANTLKDEEKAKIATGALLYVRKQVRNEHSRLRPELLITSVLFNGLHPAIGVSTNNALDKEAEKDALIAFQRFAVAQQFKEFNFPHLKEGHTKKRLVADIEEFDRSKLKKTKLEEKPVKLKHRDIEAPEHYLDEEAKKKFQTYSKLAQSFSAIQGSTQQGLKETETVVKQADLELSPENAADMTPAGKQMYADVVQKREAAKTSVRNIFNSQVRPQIEARRKLDEEEVKHTVSMMKA